MRSQQTTGGWYSDESYQVVLRPLLGVTSLKKTKEFLAKCVHKVVRTSLVDVTVGQRSWKDLAMRWFEPSYSKKTKL